MNAFKVQGNENQGTENQTPFQFDWPSLEFGYDEASDTLFRQLHVLNYEYLKLLRASGLSRKADRQSSLFDPAMTLLQRLSESHLGDLARCSSSLFDLAFNDASRWMPLLSIRPTTAFSPCDGSAPIVARFVDSALFFVWHALHNDIRFARFAFGLPHCVAQGLKELPVTSLAVVARSIAGWLEPRWSRHACFWPDLLRFAASNATVQLQVTKLLSCQLLASAKLEPKTPFNVLMVGRSQQ